MKKYFALVFLAVLIALPACRSNAASPQNQIAVTAPAISVNITRDNCGSMEVETGTQILWTNADKVRLFVMLKHLDANGNAIDAGGSDIGPGDTFSTQLLETGTYRFYCSSDQNQEGNFGTITVK